MQNTNLSPVNMLYYSNLQKNNTATPQLANKNEIKDGNKKLRNALIGLAAVGTAIAAGVMIYKGHGNKVKDMADDLSQGVKTAAKENCQKSANTAAKGAKSTLDELKSIPENGGIKKLLKEDSGLTGKFKKVLNNGDEVVLEYKNGVLKKSARTGQNAFEKVYTQAKNGDKIVKITSGGSTVEKNITRIANEAKKNIAFATCNYEEILKNVKNSNDSVLYALDKTIPQENNPELLDAWQDLKQSGINKKSITKFKRRAAMLYHPDKVKGCEEQCKFYIKLANKLLSLAA